MHVLMSFDEIQAIQICVLAFTLVGFIEFVQLCFYCDDLRNDDCVTYLRDICL